MCYWLGLHDVVKMELAKGYGGLFGDAPFAKKGRYINKYAHIYTQIKYDMYIYIYIYIFMRVYIYIYIYIYTHSIM